MVTIYALVCPLSGDIRYIGKTNMKPSKRLRGHISELSGKCGSHKQRWLRKLSEIGLRPWIWVLEEVFEPDDWRARERAWISKGIDIGLPLTNQTKGGEGLDWIDGERKEQYANKIRALSAKRHQENPGTLDKAREAAYKWRQENYSDWVQSIKDGWTPEAKETLAEAMKVVRARPGYAKALSDRSKRVWNASREKYMASFSRESTKAKHSERAKRCWGDPETRGRLMNRWTPERREAQAEVIRKRSTPEYRAHMAEKTRQRWANTPAEERAKAMQALRDRKGKA